MLGGLKEMLIFNAIVLGGLGLLMYFILRGNNDKQPNPKKHIKNNKRNSNHIHHAHT